MNKFLYLPMITFVLTLVGCDSSSSSSNAPLPTTPTVTTPVASGIDEGGNAIPGDGTLPVQPGSPITAEPGIPGEAPILGLTQGLTISRSLFLQNIGSGVATRAQDFRKATEAMNQAALSYCSSYDPEQLEGLKARFADAMILWQGLELFQMGPLLEKVGALKIKIYNWPAVSNYCKIDDEALMALADPEYALRTNNANRIGLQALEYMIYDSSLVSVCPSLNPTKAAWEAQTSAQKWAARCAYMKPVAAQLVADATELETKWGTPADNVVSRKIGDAAGEQSVIQELFNNLFYLDLQVKNEKLAKPAGQDIRLCSRTPSTCPEKEELRYSQLSRQAIAANFRAVADMVFGFGEPRSGGLAALMRSEKATEIADRAEKNITQLVSLSETQTDSFASVLASKQSENCDVSQNSWICKVRKSVLSVVADFKVEYSAVLGTTVPAAPQGDND